MARALAAAEARLGALSPRLDGVSYQSVLARGFALVTDPAGHAVTTARAVTPGKRLGLRFADGEARVIAEGTPPRRGAPKPEPEQETLL